MNYTFSEGAISMIAQFEGFRAKPYLDSVGIPTIGFGSTTHTNGTKVTMNDAIIDKEMACEMLLFHLNQLELIDLNNCITRTDLKQNQVDAIGCLMYNIGDKGFCGSTLHNKINANAPISEIEQHWLEWDRAGGKVLDGLLKRRQAEFNYYNK